MSLRAGSPSSPPPPRAEATFLAALDLEPADREAFVAETCAGDGALQAEVQRLLSLHQSAGDFLVESPATQEVEEQLARLKPEGKGDRIGRYKLLQEIGHGGFGTVWMAEQMEPVSRRVALKIIKMGMDTREVIARFEAERQALALMDHPNIAQVFDAGATQWGRPFFVMELVKGIPITGYCDEAGLGTRERLALFGDVCAAINHAHQKGVIHRDIKPSNVMITLHGDRPVVKVIDFGIAKATQGRLTDKTLFTRFEQFIGTPVYMSPEQAALSGARGTTSFGSEPFTDRCSFSTGAKLKKPARSLRRRRRSCVPSQKTVATMPITTISSFGSPARKRGRCWGCRAAQ